MSDLEASADSALRTVVGAGMSSLVAQGGLTVAVALDICPLIQSLSIRIWQLFSRAEAILAQTVLDKHQVIFAGTCWIFQVVTCW